MFQKFVIKIQKWWKNGMCIVRVGSWFEGSFTVDVSEPKPNRPNTMNLVEKRAQELGLSEDFVNRSGRIIRERDHQRRRGGIKVYPWASSKDEFFFFFSSDTSWLELSGVFRTAIPPFLWDLSGYISFCSVHLGHPSVDHAGRYLSICPIQRFPQLAVSCSRQVDTVRGSFLH